MRDPVLRAEIAAAGAPEEPQQCANAPDLLAVALGDLVERAPNLYASPISIANAIANANARVTVQ